MQQALDTEEMSTLKEAVDSALAWLDDNQAAEKEEYDARRKEVEEVAFPLLQKAMAGGGTGAAGGGGGTEGGEGAEDGPTVEEVD